MSNQNKKGEQKLYMTWVVSSRSIITKTFPGNCTI